MRLLRGGEAAFKIQPRRPMEGRTCGGGGARRPRRAVIGGTDCRLNPSRGACGGGCHGGLWVRPGAGGGAGAPRHPLRHAPVGPWAPGEQPRLSCPSWGDGAATAGLCTWRPREGLDPACCPLPPPGGGSPRGPPAPGWGSLGWGAACSPGWPGSSSHPVSQMGHSGGFKDTVKGISKSVYNVVMCGLTELNDEFCSVAVLRNCLNNDSELPRQSRRQNRSYQGTNQSYHNRGFCAASAAHQSPAVGERSLCREGGPAGGGVTAMQPRGCASLSLSRLWDTVVGS